MTDSNRFTYEPNNNKAQWERKPTVLNSDVFQYNGNNGNHQSNIKTITDQRFVSEVRRQPSIPFNTIVNNNQSAIPQLLPQPQPIYNVNQRGVSQANGMIIREPSISNNIEYGQPAPLFIQKHTSGVLNNEAMQIHSSEVRQVAVVSNSQPRIQQVIRREQQLPSELRITKVLKDQPNVQVYRESNWTSYYSPHGAQSRIPTTPPPNAVPTKTKTCCSPLLLILLGLLALAGIITGIVLALNYDPHAHAGAGKISESAGIITDQQYTVVQETTVLNTDPASATTISTGESQQPSTNGTASGQNTSNGTVISNSNIDTDNNLLQQSAGVDPLLTPIEPPSIQSKPRTNGSLAVGFAAQPSQPKTQVQQTQQKQEAQQTLQVKTPVMENTAPKSTNYTSQQSNAAANKIVINSTDSNSIVKSNITQKSSVNPTIDSNSQAKNNSSQSSPTDVPIQVLNAPPIYESSKKEDKLTVIPISGDRTEPKTNSIGNEQTNDKDDKAISTSITDELPFLQGAFTNNNKKIIETGDDLTFNIVDHHQNKLRRIHHLVSL